MIRLRGFTLLELLVAVAIFAVLATLAYGGINSVTETRRQVEGHSAELAALQMALSRLSQDIEQAVLRPVRDPYGGGQDEPLLSGPRELSDGPLLLTRTGWRNPAGSERSHLQRVVWRQQEERLLRAHWARLDRVATDEPIEQVLLEGVQWVRLRYLDADSVWHEQWPPLALQLDEAPPSLPRAVELTIALEGWGEIRRLYGRGG